MSQKPYIIKHIDKIAPIHTSHQVGSKIVLKGNDHPQSPITQIARTTLDKDTNVPPHAHASMDEHFYIIEGEAIFTIDNTTHRCYTGNYILIRAGITHAIKAISNIEILTLGIAI